MSENTNECVIEWIPGRDYVGVTAKNGSSWKNRCEELEKEFPDDVKIQGNIPMKRKRKLRKD